MIEQEGSPDKGQSARGLLYPTLVEAILPRINPVSCGLSEMETATPLRAIARSATSVAILLAFLHAALAVTANIDKSPTFDEPTHLTAGYSYWLRRDFRLDPENGNWPARLAALPLLLLRPNFPPTESLPWKQLSAGETSQRFFYRSGNDPQQMLLVSRVAMSALSAALCLLIFFCARHFFGIVGGLISETFAVFDPNLLAHGSLVTADVAAAFFFLAATWTSWQLLQRVTARTLIMSILSVSGLVLTKFSAPLFCFIATILATVRILSRDPIEIHLGSVQSVVAGRIRKTALVTVLVALGAGAVVFAIWASFCFRFSALREGGPPRELLNARWEEILSERSPAHKAIEFARNHFLLPEAYLYGLAYVKTTLRGRPAFLDGEVSNYGFKSFFPRAFIYKTPLPIFALLVAGLFVALERWRRQSATCGLAWREIVQRDLAKLTPIWAIIVVYGFFALQSPLNIGHRHLLPIYPALFIAGGACASGFRFLPVRSAAAAIGFLLAWQLIDSFQTRPDYLAYFNQATGGPDNGYKHLIDSSLDWGQDLPALKGWLDQNRASDGKEQIYLGYFGTAERTWYGIAAIELPENARDATLASLRPGLYCISATILQQAYAPAQGKWRREYEEAYQNARRSLPDCGKIDNSRSVAASPANSLPPISPGQLAMFQQLRFARLCAYLRHRKPLANIGCSILVFYLTQSDVREALDGPPAEMLLSSRD